MAADDDGGTLDLSRFKEQLGKVLLSSFAPYKKPRNNYHHLINCLAVDLEKKRGVGNTCDLEVKWKDLKKREFPEDEILDLIERAVKKVSKLRQSKIVNFFTSTASEGQSSVISDTSSPLVCSDDFDENKAADDESNMFEPETCIEEIEEETCHHFKQLCTLLDIDGRNLNLVDSSNIGLLSYEILEDLQLYKDTSKDVDETACYFQPKSDLSKKRRELDEALADLKEAIEELLVHNNIDSYWSSLCE